MKRITLMVVALLAFTFTTNLKAQTIYQQIPDGTSGIVSDYFTDISTGAFSADDFELTAQEDVYYVEVYGFQGTGATDLITTLASGFSLYIYADNSGVPSGDPTMSGTGVLEVDNIALNDPALSITEDGSGTYVFTVDINELNGAPLTLNAGRYWVVAFPHIDPTLGSGERWNWLVSSQINYTDAMLIDPSDLFGAGATSWTPIENLTGDPIFDALAFTIYDQNLAVIEQNAPVTVSLYPNPFQDQLSINLPASVELESATMFDLLGQQTVMNISENNTLNTANLASGVYILKLETNQGTMTKKVIKQ